MREAIRIILMTERRSDFVCGVRRRVGRFLFEPNTVTTRQLFVTALRKRWPSGSTRITIEAVDVEADPTDPQASIATITYKLVATQARERVSLSVS